MKEQLVKEIPQKLPPINKTPGVSGGVACVGDTRVPVWTLVELKRHGRTDAQLLQDFPSLPPLGPQAAWDYYQSHKAEIDRDTAAQD